MKYKWLLAFFLMLGTPAFAGEYMIFDPGSDTARVWIGPEPKPGVHCPVGSKVVLREVINGDLDVHNYKLSDDGKKLEWIDRQALAAAKLALNPPEPMPDPKAFLTACVDDPKISPTWYGVIGSMINVSMDAPTRIKVWEQIKQDVEMGLPSDVAEAIEVHAIEAHMPLTQSK